MMPRLAPYKAVLSALFLAAAVSFLLPFLTIAVDRRLGHGTGIELARGDPAFSGRYVHASYVGEVEHGLNLAELPATVALMALFAGAAAAWLPGRTGLWSALAGGVVGLLGLFWLRQAVTGPLLLANVHVRYGYWVSALAILAAAAASGLFVWRTSWTYLHR